MKNTVPATLIAWLRWLRERPQASVMALGIAWSIALLVVLIQPSFQFATSDSLVHGQSPSQSFAVKNTGKLTDGIIPRTGDFWNTDLTATFRRSGSITFDLGEPKTIRAIYLSGDANDNYVVDISSDGQSYEHMWTAKAERGAGMQPRTTSNLDARGRYIRITGEGGDNLFSIGEIQIFDKIPDKIPSGVTGKRGLPVEERVRGNFLAFLLAVGITLFASNRSDSWKWKLASTIPTVAAGIVLASSMSDAWPWDNNIVPMARAIAAGIAILAIGREIIAPIKWPASRAVTIGTFALAGALAFASFYNLGRLQFADHENNNRTFVHTFDMRVYYPAAKYFKELRFDGLYKASTAAYMADVPGSSQATMGKTKFRDLKTHRMIEANDVWDDVIAMESRFTPERWEAFVKDMRYFRQTMGPSYIGSMVDHGGNATPVWLAQAHLLFALTEANELTLILGGLLDPILLMLAFIALGKAYGWRTSLLCMVVFGANDFVMFGTNWAGATLRHDWLAYLMFAMAALRLKKHLLGGLLLALATSARAFPALGLVGLAFPMIGWLIWEMNRTGTWPTKAAWLEHNKPTLKVWAGAIAGGVTLFLFASLVLSFDAWPEWLAKVRLLDTEPHVNQVSLQGFVGGTDHIQASVVRSRWPLYATLAGSIAILGGIIAWKRRASLDQAAVLGCLLIPVVFNPANYYIHFVTILPLLGCTLLREDQHKTPTLRQAIVWLPALLMCVGQYWTTKIDDRGLHFETSTVLLFFAYFGTLLASFGLAAETKSGSEPAISEASEPDPTEPDDVMDEESRTPENAVPEKQAVPA
ncbi:MAG: discoidin domain-containing protein [Polyangiaceae bacterium]|nr:discoidin domain-containing protein [Polyangiaceae bacterium]